MKKYLICLTFLAFFACQKDKYSGFSGSSESIQDLTRAEEQNVLSEDSVCYFSDNGFSAWTKIASLEDRFSASDVSLEKAKSMTTDAIVRSILHYPLNYLIFAYNDPQEAVKLVVENSHLHQELIQRNDAAEALLYYFEKTEIDMKAGLMDDGSDLYVGYADGMFLEYFIASGGIKGFDNPEFLKKLLLVVEDKEKERLLDPDTYSEYSIRPLMVIKKLISSALGTKSSSFIYTYFGQALGVESIQELSTTEITNITSTFANYYPDAEVIRPASATYNCHSYAWFDQSTNNHYWLNSHTVNNSFQLQRYWTDDYYYLTTEANAERVFYASDDHSAIPLSTILYRSKWGAGPLMEHAPTYCPYISTNRQYYRHLTYLPYDITSSIVGDSPITINTVHNYSLPHVYHDMSITWSSEALSGEQGTCQSTMNSDGSCSFSANTPGAYYLYLEGYRNGTQLIAGYSIIIVYGV